MTIKKEDKKRGYFVYNPDDDHGFPIIATSAKEAKKIAWKDSEIDCEWIDIRVRWKRNTKVDDLPIGYVKDEMLAIRRGIYDWLEDATCDICNEDKTVEHYNGKVICGDCIDKINNKKE